MARRRRLFAGLGASAVLGVLLVGWLFLAPPQLGGPASYVVVHGSSMGPLLEDGDLAVVQVRDGYRLGDIVLYRDAVLGQSLLHRVVGRVGDRFVMRAAHAQAGGDMRRAALLALAILAVSSAVPVLTAANHVPRTFAGESKQAVGPDDLKPAECAGTAVLTHLATPTDSYVGIVEDELILGSAGVQKLDGERGDDCILGGAGDDVLVGGLQQDVCIGGPGNDTFHPSCERTFE